VKGLKEEFNTMAKGGNMKKALIVFVALMLAVPAVSYAGSATSRWDLTLGGYVKFDMVWANKAVGVDNRVSPVDGSSASPTAADSTDNLTWAGGETRLNWAVKGPDAWGAKTSAFVEGEFRGRTGGTEYGLFALRHAYMKLQWAKTSLIIGHTWQAWGMIPSLNMLAFAENHFNKGATRTPQVRLTHAFTKNFTGVFAIQAPYPTENTTASNGNVGLDKAANGLWPDVVGDISFASDSCGKIGAFPLKVGLGGFYGQDKYLYHETATAKFSDKRVDRWGAGFYWYVPIIPEKKGNKAGALGITGQVFAGQGMGIYLPAYPGNAYDRNNSDQFFTTGGVTTNPAFVYPNTHGGWIQATLYFTNQLFVNGVYGAQYNSFSNRFIANQATGSTTIKQIQNAVFNIMYDVNPAIRLGLEYDYVSTDYAWNETTTTTSNKGSFSSVRFGAYYFF
jgi:hypothetical protein